MSKTDEKCVIYARVSSQKQVKEGNGLESQVFRCKEYAKQKGLVVKTIFTEDGISGGLLIRPGIRAAFGYLEENPDIKIFLVDDMDRMARSVEVYFQLKAELKTIGVELEMVNQNFEDSSSGKMVEQISAAVKEYERNNNRDRVVERMRARIQEGYWPHCAPPGYENIKSAGGRKMVVPKEPDATFIREAFEGYASGQLSTLQQVADFLNENRFETKWTQKGIHVSQVIRLFKRRFYAGLIDSKKWGVKGIKGKHPAIITLDLFDRVNLIMTGKAPSKPRKDIHKDFPLRGLILCAACKKPMTSNWSKGRNQRYPYYRCDTKGCDTKSVPRDDVESDFKITLSRASPQREMVRLFEAIVKDVWEEKQASIDKDRLLSEKRIVELEGELKTSVDSYINANSGAIKTRLEARVEELEQEIKVARAAHHQIGAQEIDFETALKRTCEFLENPLQEWKNGNVVHKQRVTRLVFRKPLEFSKENGLGTAHKSLPFAVFDSSKKTKLSMVEMAGIEPASKKEGRAFYFHSLV